MIEYIVYRANNMSQATYWTFINMGIYMLALLALITVTCSWEFTVDTGMGK